MKYFAFILIASSILLQSCASILNGSKQKVAFNLPSDSTDVYINDEYLEPLVDGRYSLERDVKCQDVTIKTPGYVDENYIVVNETKSPLYIMSWIPFAVLIYPPFFDSFASAYDFKKEYTFEHRFKRPQWDSTQKNVYLKNVTLDLDDSTYYKTVSNMSRYGSTRLGKKRYYDSLFVEYSSTGKAIHEMLQETGYTDTNNTVFFDNLNNVFFKARVTQLHYAVYYDSYYNGYYPEFVVTSGNVEWEVTDVFKQTIYKTELESKSGEYSFDYSDESRDVYLKSQGDMIRSSFLTLLESDSIKTILEAEEYHNDLEMLAINRPVKFATKNSEAMKATVTLKNDEGHGSGFFINNDGYLITNHHVITMDSLVVLLSNGEEYEMEVIRSDKKSDLALCKVDFKNEYAINMGSKSYEPGDEVFAIGTPESVELGQSLSKGIISGLREFHEIEFIQSDLSVNSGNSGGPVVLKDNLTLVGVVDYKVKGYGVEGISFIVPGSGINEFLKVTYK